MSNEEMRILVVANNLLARAGLVALLESDPDYTVVGQTTLDDSLKQAVEVYEPNLLLLDLGWNSQDGEILTRFVDYLQDLPTLALVTDEHQPQMIASLLRGADGYGVLLRETDPEMLFSALRAIHDGLVVVDREFADSIYRYSPLSAPEPLVENLTPRELEVLQSLARGLTNKAIALQLNITDHTVKFHVNAIMNKLNAQSRTEAVVRATQLGLILL